MSSEAWGHPPVTLDIWSPWAAAWVAQTNGQNYVPQLPTFIWDSDDVLRGFHLLRVAIFLC